MLTSQKRQTRIETMLGQRMLSFLKPTTVVNNEDKLPCPKANLKNSQIVIIAKPSVSKAS